MKIYAVIVTFNRKDLLKKTIDWLLNQTVELEKIIIINNNSTDWTEEMILSKYNFEKIQYINSWWNIWGAWWFNLWMKEAYNQWADWIWVMDDDVEPLNNWLENILKYINVWDIINPTKLLIDNSYYNWIKLWKKYLNPILLDRNKIFTKSNYYNINTTCFEWMFVNKETIKKIWFPDKNFFIIGDDTEYWLRANKDNIKNIYIKDACLKKTLEIKDSNYIILGKSIFYESNLFKLRYQVRNNIVIHRNYWNKISLFLHILIYCVIIHFIVWSIADKNLVKRFNIIMKSIYEWFKYKINYD